MPPKNRFPALAAMRRQRNQENEENHDAGPINPGQNNNNPPPPPPQRQLPLNLVRQRQRQEPRGRVRGLNGHLNHARSWVFTLRLSEDPQATNYVGTYRMPSLADVVARFGNVMLAPPGSPPVYITYQLERGNNNDPLFGNHYHIQGYIEFDNSVNALEIVNMMEWNNFFDMDDIYLAPRQYSQHAAALYTHKDATCVKAENGDPVLRVEEGQMRNQGNNFQQIQGMIAAGAQFNEVAAQFPREALVMASGISKMIMERLKQQPNSYRNVKVFVFWGDSRTGKSRKVYELEGEKVYTKSDDTLYFDGYDSERHEALLLDECVGNFRHTQLLRWLDGQPHLVNQKFGGCWANWKRVYITSNLAPNRWYPNLDKRTTNALYKRYETGGIVKFVDENDEQSMKDHKEEEELGLFARDRPWVIFTPVE